MSNTKPLDILLENSLSSIKEHEERFNDLIAEYEGLLEMVHCLLP